MIPRPDRLWLDASGILARPRLRYATGFPMLDRRLDGGLLAGTVALLQGKPGIGLTRLGGQIAIALSKSCAVGGVFADEGQRPAAVRITRELTDKQVPFFRFFDLLTPGASIERAFAEFEEVAPSGMPRALYFDSHRLLHTEGGNDRDAVSLLREIHALTQCYGTVTLVASRIPRYVDVATALATASIELMAELVMHLDGSPDREFSEVTLFVPKNRISEAGPFSIPLRCKPQEVHFTDLPGPEDLELADRDERNVAHTAERLLRIIQRNDGLTAAAIINLLRPVRRQTILRARRRLEDAGLVYCEPRGRATCWFSKKEPVAAL